MSNIGKPCNRQTYYAVNHSDEAEPLRGATYMKFLTGHVLEELMLFLAEQSGHSVEGQQDTQEIAGIKGHRDCVIDGVLIDVKTASSYSFKKFAEGKLKENDAFGYIVQIQSYLEAGQDDPIITDKSRAGFLVIDKARGELCLDLHEKEDLPLEAIFEYKKEMVSRPEPPARTFAPEPDGKSGNEKLGVNCSYCDFKNVCYPNLRTFIYSTGPRYLTKVAKEPNVPEVT